MTTTPTIHHLRPAGEESSPAGFMRVAVFDLKLGSDLTIHNMRLVRTPSGSLQVYPPDARHGGRCADLSPAFRTEIAELAAAHMESQIATTSKAQA